jgi:hypothetical protein
VSTGLSTPLLCTAIGNLPTSSKKKKLRDSSSSHHHAAAVPRYRSHPTIKIGTVGKRVRHQRFQTDRPPARCQCSNPSCGSDHRVATASCCTKFYYKKVKSCTPSRELSHHREAVRGTGATLVAETRQRHFLSFLSSFPKFFFSVLHLY